MATADKTFRDVGHQDTALYAVEIGAFINAQQQYAGQVAPDDPDHIKNSRQKRKSYQRSDKTGRDQIPHAGDIHDFQRIDLIRDAHDPDFSGHGRARTPRDHDGRQDGTKLPDERQRNSGPQKTHRAKLHQDIISLQAKDHSRKQRNQANDEQRFRADHIQLLKDLDEQLRSYEYLPQSLQQE